MSLESILANCIEVGDCLEWQGPFGFGRNHQTPIIRRKINGGWQSVSVVRIVWTERHGAIPDGKIVYRACCNFRCVGCLALGVRGDVQRRRQRLGLAAHRPSTIAAITAGSRVRPNIVNTIEQAREVRRLVAEGLNDSRVSERTGVSVHSVRDIRRGDGWRESVACSSVFSMGASA